MRNRHVPRLCSACHAPMASGGDACWLCGTAWAAEDQPAKAKLRVIPGGATEQQAPARKRAAAATRG